MTEDLILALGIIILGIALLVLKEVWNIFVKMIETVFSMTHIGILIALSFIILKIAP